MIWMARVGKAVGDLRYLLNRRYPRESAVNFVSNHYRLTLDERHLLARCVFSKREIAAHMRKAVGIENVKGKKLGVDGYNVLITLESILTGKKVILCDDGYIRDLRAVFGKYRAGPATPRAISGLIQTAANASPKEIIVLFDKQVSRSGELAADVRKKIELAGLKGDALTVGGVDMKLRDFDVVASSDRAVIERAKSVWDIPATFLSRKGAKVLDMKKLGKV